MKTKKDEENVALRGLLLCELSFSSVLTCITTKVGKKISSLSIKTLIML